MADQNQQLNLVIDPEVRALMEKRMILLEDVRNVISHAEATGEKILSQSGRFIASYRPANVTYWVEYSARESEFLVHNAWSHRMEVG